MTPLTERLVEAGAPALPENHWYACEVSVRECTWEVGLKLGSRLGPQARGLAFVAREYYESPHVVDFVEQAKEAHRQAFPEANFRTEVQVLLLGKEVGCALSE